MLKHFDHVTVAVTDPAAAIAFFALLGFEWKCSS
jgi:catechol 2,3-dioxygenase-like lactoylglutathione lyase family enzyme